MRTSPSATTNPVPISHAPAGTHSGQVNHMVVSTHDMNVDLTSPPAIASPTTIGASPAGAQLFSTGQQYLDTHHCCAGEEQATSRTRNGSAPNGNMSARPHSPRQPMIQRCPYLSRWRGHTFPTGQRGYHTHRVLAGRDQAENGECS